MVLPWTEQERALVAGRLATQFVGPQLPSLTISNGSETRPKPTN
jgi:hypothetical protein